ncbi:MAG: bifunctional glutamate N-acetyltransferase/amino-acid acetyltransferase ArgJ [Planctomycetia bacterium]|nr:bifunctional glutamate N-acetyltransferase/amino-acid acetyltransferase ArgJ [Planctomycetia bacterium]
MFIPRGFRFGAIYSGIKRDASREDLTLIVSDKNCAAAGVYTRNLVCAAPVTLDRSRTPAKNIRAVVVNSGNANACTGQQGMKDAKQMAEWAARAAGASKTGALVMSTGIIGHFLPMEILEKGIAKVSQELGDDAASLEKAARGIMTTDTKRKLFTRQIMVDGVEVRLAAMGKGAGMIAPNMATFLGCVLTDAKLAPAAAQKLLQKVADDTFNCITVDGHTSTNDTLLLLANGASGSVDVAKNKDFENALHEICAELARSIPADGEGASHLVTIHTRGLKTKLHARRIARLIAESPLVKCAFAGNDPNWGRIVSAAGYSGVDFDVKKVTLHVNGFLLFEKGAPADFDADKVSRSMSENHEIVVELQFAEGNADARFWTCDLTTEYVHINADYHT